MPTASQAASDEPSAATPALTDADEADGLWHDADDQLTRAQARFSERVIDADLSCSVFDATISGDDEHNCVGCNLQVRCDRVHWFLTSGREGWEPEASVEYLMWQLNALYECVRDICNLVDAPAYWREDERTFGAFVVVRAWANFFKHPGVVTHSIHHPRYSFEGTPAAHAARRVVGKQSRNERKIALIDTDLVRKEWTKDQPDTKRLNGATSAFVILPNLPELMDSVADNYKAFVDVLVDNPMYRERIRSCSTRPYEEC